MTIETEEFDNLIGSGEHLSDSDYFAPLFDIDLLDEEIEEVEHNKTYYLSAYYERTMPDRFLTIGREIDDVISKHEFNSTDIVNYLTIRQAFEKYPSTFERLVQLLEGIKRKNETTVYRHISQENAKYLVDKHFKSLYSSTQIQEMFDEDDEEYRKYIDKKIDDELWFLNSVWSQILLETHFRHGKEMMEYAVAEFRRYARIDKDHIASRLKVAVQQFKADRLEPVSKPHWAKLAAADEKLIGRIIRNEPVEPGSCHHLYDDDELTNLKRNKLLLDILRNASDPENLFLDWKILFDHDELFDRFVNFHNVMFLFGRIHRENLIKCEMYDGLKEQYHKFIYGEEEDTTDTPVPTLPKAESHAPEQEQMELQPSEIPEVHYIHQQIDEDKLIALIRDYTDGPNKSNYFVNKSHWLSIYTVLHQKLKALGNSPIFLFSSRPKFAEWVNLKIQPHDIPCDKGALDNAPKYFREENSYPWSIADYHKSGGSQDQTSTNSSMVADYFQRNLIDQLKNFLIK